MPKNKNHFVPKFYLKFFESAPRRIHLYNLERSKIVKDASLRDQCHRRKYYGNDDQVEDYLASIENAMAPHLQSVITNGVLPPFSSYGHLALLAFVCSQIVRTPSSANRIRQLIDKMEAQAYSEQQVPSELTLENEGLGSNYPIMVGLQAMNTIVRAYLDLKAYLVISPDENFLTSDNPVFRYNQYCERIQYMGVIGAGNRGLQLFVPLSPRFLLILYDGATYEAGGVFKFLRRGKATPADVNSLNKLLLLGAEENVYFARWDQRRMIRRLLPEINHFRREDTTAVQEYAQDDDPNGSLIHGYERLQNVSLNLSFLRIRKSARRVPLEERAQGLRSQPLGPTGLDDDAQPIRFSRFIGRR